MPADLQSQVDGLRRRVRRGRRRSVLLGNGAVVVVVLGLLCWTAHYASSVLSYAELQDIDIRRDSVDADRLTLLYRPISDGTVGFRRADGDRETELLDRIAPGAVGKKQRFEWRISGVRPGDLIKVTSLGGWSLQTTELRVPEPGSAAPSASAEMPGSAAPLGDSVISGRIVNAINKEPVAGATVRILGTKLSAKTDSRGQFRIPGAPTATVPVEVSADGFTVETFQQDLTSGRDSPVRVALSPGMEKGQIRLVLTWGDAPKDLDAHLEGPLPEDNRFHVYYHQQGDLKSQEFVRLDVDDRRGGGPETITVLGVLPGTYRYFVHDYTNRDDPESNALARSGAEVKLYQGGQTYRFRAGHDMVGNVWDVCTIEVTPDGAVVNKVDEYNGVKVAALGLYDKRTMADRQQWIGSYGGSAISEKAVNDGLQWLARHQGPDGHWSCDTMGTGAQTQCEAEGACTGEGKIYEMAHSGLALLAFQAGGHYYFNDSKYSQVVRKGLDWVVSHQGPEGELIGTAKRHGYPKYHKHYMYEHGIAAFALTDACAAAAALGQPQNEAYYEAAKKAVDFIQRYQYNDGGWRYSTDLNTRGDTSVVAWQIMALKSAKEAGIEVSERCVEGVRKYLRSRETGENGRTGYENRTPHTEATTGVGMVARQLVLGESDAPLIQDAADYLAGYAERTWGNREVTGSNSDFYLWYYCTLAMFQVGGERWERWNDVVRDTIIQLQRHEGCERGSWDPASKWGGPGGRIYSTALAILSLEVYYRYTPQHELETGVIDVNLGAVDREPAEPEPTKTEAIEPEPVELHSRGSQSAKKRPEP